MPDNNDTNPLNEMSFQGEPHAAHFDAFDPKVLKQIDALIQLTDAGKSSKTPDNRDLVREIIVTALKAQVAGLARGDTKILSRALRELRYGFRIFKDYRDRRKVTIFGSARTSSNDPDYKLARQFAQKMAKAGYMIITGAGPGIMKAGNEGAGKNNSFGINIRLPYEQAANEFIAKDTKFIDCRFFFTRKLMFLKETSAAVMFPGGFGTHDEAMEALTLVQTGKCDPMPLVFVEAPGSHYWRDWKRYIVKHLLKKGKISPEDMGLIKITSSVDDAVQEILKFYRNYHSLRFVKDRLAIRVQKQIQTNTLAHLNKNFRDICAKGEFVSSAALPEENDWPELPRLLFHFNRFHFGRLRQLIDFLNEQ